MDLVIVIAKAVSGYAIPFVLFTVMGLILQGRKAVQWSAGLLASVRTNLALALAGGVMAPVLTLSVVGVRAGYDALGLPQAPMEFWQACPPWLAVLAWLVAIDFIDYWNHRLLHSGPFWPVHAVHHSDPDMNWTTSYRVHVLELCIMQISYILLASWMNLPAEGLGFVVGARLLHNNWVHTRYDLSLGWLDRVIATPRYHHWHHADDPAAYNTNFGNTFAIWDVIFGTYRVPGRYTGTFGFEESPGNDILKLVILPFHAWIQALLKLARKPEQKKNKLLTQRSSVDTSDRAATVALKGDMLAT